MYNAWLFKYLENIEIKIMKEEQGGKHTNLSSKVRQVVDHLPKYEKHLHESKPSTKLKTTETTKLEDKNWRLSSFKLKRDSNIEKEYDNTHKSNESQDNIYDFIHMHTDYKLVARKYPLGLQVKLYARHEQLSG